MTNRLRKKARSHTRLRHKCCSRSCKPKAQIVTADKVKQGKPEPEPYRMGAAQLGLNPAECLVIEDAPSGIRAGKAAGCRVLAVASSHQPHELQEADWIIDSLTDLELQSNEDGTIQCRFVMRG